MPEKYGSHETAALIVLTLANREVPNVELTNDYKIKLKTTVSFITSRTRTSDRMRTALVVGFIAVTTIIYLSVGTAPTTLLVFAGAFNGLLLPVGIGVLLWVAWRRKDLLNGYRYPAWLLGIGGAAWLLTIYLAVRSVRPVIDLFN